MAKIYETKEDFERDKLDEQAKDLHIKSGDQFISGVATGALGSIIHFVFRNRVSGAASVVLNVFGAFGMVKSFFTLRSAHDLERQRERMGPDTIVLPHDMPMNNVGDLLSAMHPGSKIPPEIANKPLEPDCGCPLKRHAQFGPTSLLEQAMRGDSTPVRE